MVARSVQGTKGVCDKCKTVLLFQMKVRLSKVNCPVCEASGLYSYKTHKGEVNQAWLYHHKIITKIEEVR